jgi:hypothetical protein
MAEQDDVTQGAIPPKVSPFAKPENSAPAGAGAPRPITVRLKPVVPAAAAPQPPVNPRATARVPVPDAVAAAAPAAIRPATVHLRPVAPPAGAPQPPPKVELSATAPITPLQPQHPPVPGGNPLPDGPKPPSSAQVQAAKSKTSRISLDSAIGAAPAISADGPKTIRLKRPSDLTAPAAPTAAAAAAARKTSRIPDSALPGEGSDDSAAVTQKKTLKIKRPGAKPEAAESAGGDGFPEGVQMTQLSPIDLPVKAESSVFTAFAVVCASAAAVVLVLLTLCLGAHAVGPDAGKNSLASINFGQFQFPWVGGINH